MNGFGSKLTLATSEAALRKVLKREAVSIVLPATLHDIYWFYKEASYSHVSVFLPDGMPLVFFSRLFHNKKIGRIYGPDFFAKIITKALDKKHIFIGSHTVLNKIIKKVAIRETMIIPVGYGEAHGLLSEYDYKQIIAFEPDYIWLGLGSPKQVILAAEIKEKLDQCNRQSKKKVTKKIIIGCVGAGIDFFAQEKKQAHVLIRNLGLEWLFRLSQEPRRLWKRYCIYSVIGFLNLYFFDYAFWKKKYFFDN